MYICAKCNSLVAQPMKQWWSRRPHCRNGHVLYIGGIGASLEKPFWRAFCRGLAGGLGMTFVLLLLAGGPDYKARPTAAGLALLVASYYLLASLYLFARAWFWTRRSGPIQRLVANARGRACGALAAIPSQIGLVMLMGLRVPGR
jgi:hypothetical protein